MSVMRHDAYGLPVTTSCVSALESYARGVEGLLGWRADALEQFRAALARDPALLVGGNPADAERAMREHLAAHPRDLVILQRLYFVWFWQGRFPEMLEFTTAATRHYAGEAFLPGPHAFALEQAGRSDEAVRLAEPELVREPRDAWGVHAWAHAVYELAAFDTGIARLPPKTHRCAGLNWFQNHLAWHLALMHFARGEYEAASAIGRRAFPP